MAIRSGEQLLQSLRDGRQMFIDGDRVGDVTTDPRFATAARSLAQLYDMQHDPALIDRMTFLSPTSGERVGLSFIEPRSVDDLIRRRDMVRIWADATCGMFGRSPDYMNIFITGFASAAEEFGKKDQSFAENIRGYHEHIRENDVCMTHTLINPQVDRSRPVEKQDKDLAAKIVKETGAGIVVRGARMVSTLCAYSNDLLVLPSTYIANSKEAEPYAFRFSVEVDAPGLRFICRPSVIHQNAASPMDYPLSSRLDETDAMVVFDDVLVPWERVFIHRDPELCNGLYNRTASCRKSCNQEPGQSRVHDGFGFRHRQIDQIRPASARTGHAGRADPVHRVLPHVPQGERGRRGAGTWRRNEPGGNAAVDRADDVSENVRADVRNHSDLGAGGLVAVPSYAELDGPAGADVATYFQAANAEPDADQIVSPGFRRRSVVLLGPPALYERYTPGDPVRLAGTLYGLYDKDTHIDRIFGNARVSEKADRICHGFKDLLQHPNRGLYFRLPSPASGVRPHILKPHLVQAKAPATAMPRAPPRTRFRTVKGCCDRWLAPAD